MHVRRWGMGVFGAGAVLGLTMSGCGSSTDNKGTSDAGDGGAEAACMPEAVNATDSGACTACVATMCNAEVMACSTDCTCGMAVNTLGNCLATLPPASADAGGGGLGALFPGGLALLTCLQPLLPPVGGGGGAGAGMVSAATQSFAQCLLFNCNSACVPAAAMPEGGADGGIPEASAPDASAADARTTDAPSGDAGSDGANGDASSDAPSESEAPDGGSEAGD